MMDAAQRTPMKKRLSIDATNILRTGKQAVMKSLYRKHVSDCRSD